METIVAVHRNYFGDIISFVTSTGRVISYQKALLEAETGLLLGVQTKEGDVGNVILFPELEQSFDHYPELF